VSSWDAVRCDGCGLVGTDATDKRPLPGWYVVRIQRRDPFLDTGYLDLCPTCGDCAYTSARTFPRPPPKSESQPSIAWMHPAVKEEVSSLIAAVIGWAEQSIANGGPRTELEQRLLNAHVDLARACAREMPESQSFRLPVAEYVCTSDRCKGLSTRVRATGSAIPNNPPKCSYCIKPMEQVEPRVFPGVTDKKLAEDLAARELAARARPRVKHDDVSTLPCRSCGGVIHHPLGEFRPLDRVRTKVDKEKIPAGALCIVREWSQYGSPIYYRVHLAQDEQERENYDPCELERAS
jgi:hypothetical protein